MGNNAIKQSIEKIYVSDNIRKRMYINILQKVSDFEEKRKRRMELIKIGVPIMASVSIIAVIAAFGNNKIYEYSYGTEKYTLGNENDGGNIFINEIENMQDETVNLGKNYYNTTFTEKTVEELIEYYGSNLLWNKLPNNYEYISEDDRPLGFIKREFENTEGKIVYDGNTLKYQDNNSGKSISVTAVSTIPQNADISVETEKENNNRLVESELMGVNLYICHYETNSGNECYTAEFKKDVVNFSIESEGVDKDEFLKFVKILLE
ncbi:MAG: hypothetical protein ACI4EW_05265 [Butyrivibrio sp.]